MSVFDIGQNIVHRRVVIPAIKAAQVFDIPAGAHVLRAYARNRSTTAVNLSLGNAAAGTQYLAATAIPVGDNVGAIQGAGLLGQTAATYVAPSKVASNVHVTLSAYPIANPTAATAKQQGAVDVVIEYVELLDSLPIPTQHTPRAY